MGEFEAQLRKFQKELSAGTVSLALLAVLAKAGPPRRYYRINDEGRAVLRQWIAAWNATRDSLESVLEGVER